MTMLNSLTAIASLPSGAGRGGPAAAAAEGAPGFADAMKAANAGADATSSPAPRPAPAGAGSKDPMPAPEAVAPIRVTTGKPARPITPTPPAPSGKAAAPDSPPAEAMDDEGADAPDRTDDAAPVAVDAAQPPVLIAQPLPTHISPIASVAGEAIGAARQPIALVTAAADPTDAVKLDAVAPATAEAAALLQMVRDQLKTGATGAGEGSSADATPPAPEGLADAGPSAPAATPALTAANAPQTVIAPGAPGVPTIDLSASLGKQAVDMGVSGQWLDGLAHDIAGLSANGAQGRFQINTDQLGQVQVDIRQGADGAAVSLTVASAAAELALRQDSDRLKLDAGLAAVRISEVKVERAPHVAEAARSETTGHQNSAQQQGQATGQHGTGQAMGQSSGQSQMRGRGQARENIAIAHKGSSDAVVLNHEQTGDAGADLPRARYA